MFVCYFGYRNCWSTRKTFQHRCKTKSSAAKLGPFEPTTLLDLHSTIPGLESRKFVFKMSDMWRNYSIESLYWINWCYNWILSIISLNTDLSWLSILDFRWKTKGSTIPSPCLASPSGICSRSLCRTTGVFLHLSMSVQASSSWPESPCLSQRCFQRVGGTCKAQNLCCISSILHTFLIKNVQQSSPYWSKSLKVKSGINKTHISTLLLRYPSAMVSCIHIPYSKLIHIHFGQKPLTQSKYIKANWKLSCFHLVHGKGKRFPKHVFFVLDPIQLSTIPSIPSSASCFRSCTWGGWLQYLSWYDFFSSLWASAVGLTLANHEGKHDLSQWDHGPKQGQHISSIYIYIGGD